MVDMNSWIICIVLASHHDDPGSIPGSGSILLQQCCWYAVDLCSVPGNHLHTLKKKLVVRIAFVKKCRQTLIRKRRGKKKRNEIQSPEKYLLLMTSWDPFFVPSTSKVHPMGRDKNRYEISAKRTLAIRKRRPRNVNLGICYVPSTSQTSQSDVFWTSMGLHCAIWGAYF
jgi:hypothetical protein